MFEDVELITLISGLGVFLFIIIDRRMFTLLPNSRLLVASYGLFLVGWVATVVESAIFPNVFNLIEHATYAAGSIALLIWCVITFKRSVHAH